MSRVRSRFHGQIAGVGTTSGVRIVVGHWTDTPLGAFSDAMVETAEGHRVLLAPHGAAAEFIAATYEFDEIRVEPFAVTVVPSGSAGAGHDAWQVRSASLRLDLTVGRRTGLGRLLRAVPRQVAQAPWWCAVTDPVARRVLDGVRTQGSFRDRREWYGATDHRAVLEVSASFDGADLGALRPLDPPATFGFSSAPKRPSLTSVVTTVEYSAAG